MQKHSFYRRGCKGMRCVLRQKLCLGKAMPESLSPSLVRSSCTSAQLFAPTARGAGLKTWRVVFMQRQLRKKAKHAVSLFFGPEHASKRVRGQSTLKRKSGSAALRRPEGQSFDMSCKVRQRDAEASCALTRTRSPERCERKPKRPLLSLSAHTKSQPQMNSEQMRPRSS